MKRKSRRVLLFVPGNSPALIRTSTIINTDTIIIDLEDSVSIKEKDSARYLVKNACESLSFGNKEIAVRINPFNTPWGDDDLKVVANLKQVNTIVLPKSTPETAKKAEKYLEGTNIEIICLIETAYGIQKAYEIATSSKIINGIALGAEDLAVDMNLLRTLEGEEILFARNTVVIAANAAKVQPIDTPFTSLNNLEGLKKDTLTGKLLGFTAKASISPFHVKVIKDVFTPTSDEVDYARRVVEAAKDAEKRGLGAIQLDGKMLDLPIVLRAQNTLNLVEGEKL